MSPSNIFDKVEIPKEYIKKSEPITEAHFSSWDEVKKIFGFFTKQWIFRGQLKAELDISSTLDRFGKRWSAESFKEFSMVFKNCSEYYPEIKNSKFNQEFEWLCLMRHYGIPTPLVDWTSCPYIASFFSFFEPLGILKDPNCVVWAINKEWCKHNTFLRIKKIDYRITQDTDLTTDEYFRKLFWSPEHCFNFVYPFNYPSQEIFKRARVQKSIFLCQGSSEQTFMDNLFFYNGGDSADFDIIRERKEMILKFVIPRELGREVLKDLEDSYGISHKFLFDSLDNYASYIEKGLLAIDKYAEKFFRDKQDQCN